MKLVTPSLDASPAHERVMHRPTREPDTMELLLLVARLTECRDEAGFDRSMQAALNAIATSFDADRCALFEVGRPPVEGWPLHATVGADTSVLPALEAAGDLGRMFENGIEQGAVLCLGSPSDLPAFGSRDANALGSAGIRSVLLVPAGPCTPAASALVLVSFRERAWTSAAICGLRLLGGVLVGAMTRRGSHDQRDDAVRFERLVGELLSGFAAASWRDIDHQADVALSAVLEFAAADRLGLFTVDAGSGLAILTREVRADGVAPAIGGLELARSPWLQQRLLRDKEVVCFSRTEELPEQAAADRKLIEGLGIRSGVYLGLEIGGHVRQVLSLATTRSERSWDPHLLERLKALGKLVVDALALKSALDQRLHDERELARAQLLARSVLNAFHECLCVVQAGGLVVEVSDSWRGFAEATGAADLLPGQDFFARMAASAKSYRAQGQLLAENVRTMLAGGQDSFAVETVCDGPEGPRIFDSRLARLSLGSFSYVAISHQEITRRRRGENELHNLQLQQWHTERVKRTGLLIGSLAHELSQPLTAILGNAQAGQRILAANPADVGEIGDIFRDIAHDVKRAGEVIESLRVMLRRQQSARHVVDLAALVHSVTVLLKNDLMTAGVALESSYEAACFALLDRAQIQQVLLNLMMNGMEAMGKRPPEQRRLCISVQHTGHSELEVVVRDTGTGMSQERFRKVLDAFWTTKAHGTGVGLAIARSIVESHGGRIRLARTNGEGATLVVSLPAAARPLDATEHTGGEPDGTLNATAAESPGGTRAHLRRG